MLPAEPAAQCARGQGEAVVGGAPRLDHAALFAALPTPYLVMDPQLVIVDANDAYLAVVGRTREELVGRPVFDAFPALPDALDETGVSRVQRSFEKARDTGRPDTMPLQKYDIPDPATGGYVERFWSLISVPVLDGQGRTTMLLQRAEDVTEFVRARQAAASGESSADAVDRQRRLADLEADLYARVRELEQAQAAEARASRQLAALADVALLLARTQSADELCEVIVGRGLQALGATGGAVALLGDGPQLRVALSPTAGSRTRALYGELSVDGPLPGSVAARTGRRLLFPDAAAVLAEEGGAELLERTGCCAWVALPLRSGGDLLGSLSLGWTSPQQFSGAQLEVLEALAAQCADGLSRIRARDAEQAAAAAVQRMSETLQRSLLTEPPQPDDLQIAVRYRPAAEEAQVGGDWYDAFVTSAGATTLVIGDVAGHDRDAAATMGQLRNLLRGIAYTISEPPAAVLSAVDRALRDLAVNSLATAVVASVHDAEAPDAPERRLVWSSAGHPPPVLLLPDGRAELLTSEPDLLLGLDADAERHDHAVDLPPGATVLLFTDGLVERRGASLDDGLAWLQRAVAAAAGQDLEALCDGLLAQVGEREDDIALLALRLHTG